MMKLDNLQENIDCAKLILSYWPCDQNSLVFWRASANTIFKAQCQNTTCYLRYCPIEERNEDEIILELEFIQYLKDAHFPVVEPLASLNNHFFETVYTPKGVYYATVFKEAPGQTINYSEMTPEIAQLYGEVMAKLHLLSSNFSSTVARPVAWYNKLAEIERLLIKQRNEAAALQECRFIQKKLQSYPIDEHHYGMIHYDFESDNIFYDSALHECQIIDFGDAHYNWFLADVASTLKGIKNDAPERSAIIIAAFLTGYTKHKALPATWQEDIEIFYRYHTLEHYAQIIWSKQGYTPARAPLWMQNLHKKFTKRWEKQRHAYQLTWPTV